MWNHIMWNQVFRGFKEWIHNGNMLEYFPHIHNGEQPKDSHEELIGENLTEEIRLILEGNTSQDLLNEAEWKFPKNLKNKLSRVSSHFHVPSVSPSQFTQTSKETVNYYKFSAFWIDCYSSCTLLLYYHPPWSGIAWELFNVMWAMMSRYYTFECDKNFSCN